ncbi:hypothetical protein Tamer19_28910 [Cupriavidus sp. TA19]|nr:hypothetical protein Tamer19_28910 [Cupriavidus sp. TA19]
MQEAGGIVACHADQSEPGGGTDDSAGLQGFKAGGEFRGLGIHHWHCEIVAIVGTDCRDKAGWKGTDGGARGRGAQAAPEPPRMVGARLPVIIWGYEIFGRGRRRCGGATALRGRSEGGKHCPGPPAPPSRP